MRNRVPRLTEKNPTANATLVEHVNGLGARTSPRAGCPWPVARTAYLDRPNLPEPHCTSRIEENAGSPPWYLSADEVADWIPSRNTPMSTGTATKQRQNRYEATHMSYGNR
ncbi:hypothetical protein [Rhodococcus sp. IEGM 1307]|uniref:hypothetical protein n=1 Tax=Rhodococcus sp. IEGM 1307 TaxID=3047091 RepID=UPI0024B7E641|nr:hypothetical protein [Rhodococcus sp. IEGM 1307]MDI9978619.1 hypothetical protein [Rhodococcus sp. IEGM 1307]